MNNLPQKGLFLTLFFIGLLYCFWHFSSDDSTPNSKIHSNIDTTEVVSKHGQNSNLSKSNEKTTHKIKTTDDKPANSAVAPQCEESTLADVVVRENRLRSAIADLKSVADANSALIHYRYARKLQKNEQLKGFVELQAQQANNPMLSHFILSLCASGEKSEHCTEDVEQNAIANDANNGATWFNIALWQIQNNDVDAATHAIEQVIQSPRYNSYWGNTIKLFIAETSHIDDIPLEDKFGYALQNMANATPSLSIITTFCQSHLNNDDLRSLCLSLGNYLNIKADTTLINLVGANIEQMVFTHEQNNQAAEEIEQKKTAFLDKIRQNYPKLLHALSDERFVTEWLNNIESLGESQTFQWFDETPNVQSLVNDIYEKKLAIQANCQ